MKHINIEIKCVPSLQRMLSWFICSVNSFSAIVSVRGTESEKRLLKFFILFISLDQNAWGDARAVWIIIVFWNIRRCVFCPLHESRGANTTCYDVVGASLCWNCFLEASFQNLIGIVFTLYRVLCFFVKAVVNSVFALTCFKVYIFCVDKLLMPIIPLHPDVVRRLWWPRLYVNITIWYLTARSH